MSVVILSKNPILKKYLVLWLTTLPHGTTTYMDTLTKRKNQVWSNNLLNGLGSFPKYAGIWHPGVLIWLQMASSLENSSMGLQRGGPCGTCRECWTWRKGAHHHSPSRTTENFRYFRTGSWGWQQDYHGTPMLLRCLRNQVNWACSSWQLTTASSRCTKPKYQNSQDICTPNSFQMLSQILQLEDNLQEMFELKIIYLWLDPVFSIELLNYGTVFPRIWNNKKVWLCLNPT